MNVHAKVGTKTLLVQIPTKNPIRNKLVIIKQKWPPSPPPPTTPHPCKVLWIYMLLLLFAGLHILLQKPDSLKTLLKTVFNPDHLQYVRPRMFLV
jgi:hypothetical protein